jgi:hypothetical protein
MAPSRFTIVGVTTATALILGSCGQAPDDSADPALQPPRPIRVAEGSGAATAEAALGSDAAMSTMPAFMGFTYEAGPDLPPLPTNATGYQYRPDATVDAARVNELAAALGVEGEAVPGGGAEVDGLSWRVGPDDGSAPSLTVGADPQLSVNYSQAWNSGVATVGCAVAEDGGSRGEIATDEGTPDAAVTDIPADAVEPAVEPDSTVVSPPDTTCEEPEPPANVPSAEEAEALAADVLETIGLDPATFEFETYADDWAASVTAWSQLDGVRSPISWGFGYAGNAELQWMNGTLATPVPTGPYPLIDLDDALERLEEQNGWFGGGGVAMGDVALMTDSSGSTESGVDPAQPVPVEGETAPADTVSPPPTDLTPVDTLPVDSVPVDSVPVDTVPVDTVPVDSVPVEVTTEVATLVDVRADLWWAWDDDGSVWLLPAYTFTDTEDRVFTVPAVTDEFLIIPEPALVDPMPVEPLPAEPPAEVPEPADQYGIVGRSVDEATKVLDAEGLTIRVVIEDGEALAVTEDFSTSRVNVEVADGVVVAVVSIG